MRQMITIALLLIINIARSETAPLWIYREEIIQQDIAFPDYVFCQLILETGWGKHIQGNNLFGFNNGQHMNFKHWSDCIAYYKKWQSNRYKGHRSWWEHIYQDWKAPNMQEYLQKIRWVYRVIKKIKNPC